MDSGRRNHSVRLPRCIMLLAAAATSLSNAGRPRFSVSVVATATHSASATPFRKPALGVGRSCSSRKSYKLAQVHIVHRHGDRTPITPLKNETFWEEALPSEHVLKKLFEKTKLVQGENDKPNSHMAGGRGPFGQLSQLGLLQMVDLGSKLRDELFLEEPQESDHHVDEHGNRHVHHGRLFHHEHLPLHPRHVKIQSTDFPRTIQSVQGVLVGLFPDAPDETLHIDVRHTSVMIPDPQPRRSQEQQELEKKLASRPHLMEREREMKDLAVRATEALRPLLAEDAFAVSYGVGEEHSDSDAHLRPLAWTQLSEITKCLQVRNKLPEGISEEDHELISSHAAWKWMESLRHPRLSYLAMNPMVSRIVESMRRKVQGLDDEPALHLYSAHDSTLIGLLCAFRLEPPIKWPEYGSYLKIELVEVGTMDEDGSSHEELQEKEFFVRFSLNGEILRSKWDPEHEAQPLEIIDLDTLYQKVSTEGVSTMPQ